MENLNCQEESASGKTTTLHIFRQFQDLYGEQLKNIDETGGGVKLKVKILENWVKDLTDQNLMLVKIVDELEGEALKRLGMLEASTAEKTQVTPCFSSSDDLSPNTLDKVEFLSLELEEVKQQLSDKEKLILKYQSRIEELRGSLEKEKSDNNNKVYVHRYSMTERMLQESNLDYVSHEQTSVHKELETTQIQLCQMEHEVTQLKKKLKDAESSIKRLRGDLVASEKNAKEMRSALTAEVAEKHDQILALRREVTQLEDQLRQADMQTHFKDDIIKELRKEVKVARSKETLVEVLGIKERSLSHLEHLTEQLEQKEHTISCLKAKLQQYKDIAPDTLYKVKQQVDWFTENISQQCAKGNVPEEFKKCITTMLEELRESIECCNFGPTSTTEPCKDSVQFMKALQNSLDHSHQSLCQSWTSIWETAHQHVDQWRKCLSRQQCLQQQIQELIQSVVRIISSSNNHAEAITSSINSLHYTLGSLKEELNEPHGKRTGCWLKKIHYLVTESISKIEETSRLAATIRRDETDVLKELQTRMQSMERQLTDLTTAEQKAHHLFCRMEKAQKTKLDTLLATVLHHHEIWNQHTSLSDDMKREIIYLIEKLKQSLNESPRQNNRIQETPVEHRSFHVRSLVTQLSTEIRSSISDMQHRQSQVSDLELDLSSVKVVLESAQQEIADISQNCKMKDIQRQVMCVLNKVKKEIGNALVKASSLIDTYKITKQDYVSSSERILKLQEEFILLEEELHSFHYYQSHDFKEAPKTPRIGDKFCPVADKLESYKKKDFKEAPKTPRIGDKFCPVVDKLESYKKKNPGQKDSKLQKNILQEQCLEMQRLTAMQEETIQVLQNSLNISQKEAEELHTKICSLEVKNAEVEKECKKKIQEFQNKISDLQSSLKQSEDTTRKYQKSEAALQIVIANLKETMAKEQKRCSEIQKDKKQLEEKMASITDAFKDKLEHNSKREATVNEENYKKITELKKQAMKVTEIEAQLKTIQEKLCDTQCHERQLQQELLTKEAKFKEDIFEKQREITKLTNVVKSMTDKLKGSSAELEAERGKCCEVEERLQTVCAAYEELKLKVKEKEKTADKLWVALTQLSSDEASRQLASCNSIKHYQDECARFEALYNTTASKLQAKEVEASKMVEEIERLKNELVQFTMRPVQQREEDACPYLLGRVQELSRELQMAHLCQHSYETRLKEETEKYSKKVEEAAYLKTQLKQITLQRDDLLSDLQKAQEDNAKLKVKNSELHSIIQKLEQSEAQLSEQMRNVQQTVCDSRTSSAHPACHQTNVEIQRQISDRLSNQLRTTTKKLHTTRHEYKLLEEAYEDLNHKYSLMQKGEHDLDRAQESKTHCTPCMAKSSKSVAHVKYTQEEKIKVPYMAYTSHSKSWHQFETSKELERRERKWKEKLQKVIRGDYMDTFEMLNNSSSN